MDRGKLQLFFDFFTSSVDLDISLSIFFSVVEQGLETIDSSSAKPCLVLLQTVLTQPSGILLQFLLILVSKLARCTASKTMLRKLSDGFKQGSYISQLFTTDCLIVVKHEITLA